MTKLIAVLLLAAACGKGGASTPSGPRAHGTGFSVAIPDGWAAQTGADLADVVERGGVVLGRDLSNGGVVDAIMPSIAVVPVTAPWGGDPADPATCTAFARDTARTLKSKVAGARSIKLSTGPSCQYELAEEADPARGAVGTVVRGQRGSWVVTCNLDLRVARHREACDAVLGSFVEEKP